MPRCILIEILGVSTSSLTKGLILQRNVDKMGLNLMMMTVARSPSFLSIRKTSGAFDKELAASGQMLFIDENAEENGSNSDDGDDDDDVDSTSKRESEGGDAVSVKINSLKIADQDSSSVPDLVGIDSNAPETLSDENPNGENKSTNATADTTGDAKGSTEAPRMSHQERIIWTEMMRC